MTKDTTATIGENIQQLRKDRGWLQDELATKTGLTVTTVGKHERAESTMSIADALKYADALSVSLDVLCGRKRDAVYDYLRTKPIHMVTPQALAAIKKAKDTGEIAELFVEAKYVWGYVIGVGDIPTTDEAFRIHQQEMDAAISRLSPPPRRRRK